MLDMAYRLEKVRYAEENGFREDYLATEPHFMKASAVSPELPEKVRSIMGWPAREEDYACASKEIPYEVTRQLMAVRTSDECPAKAQECMDAGVTCPILFPIRP
jgi:5,10-methylenetetrahydromethanopterin reductase